MLGLRSFMPFQEVSEWDRRLPCVAAKTKLSMPCVDRFSHPMNVISSS
jgi:hypothetical protein